MINGTSYPDILDAEILRWCYPNSHIDLIFLKIPKPVFIEIISNLARIANSRQLEGHFCGKTSDFDANNRSTIITIRSEKLISFV